VHFIFLKEAKDMNRRDYLLMKFAALQMKHYGVVDPEFVKEAADAAAQSPALHITDIPKYVDQYIDQHVDWTKYSPQQYAGAGAAAGALGGASLGAILAALLYRNKNKTKEAR
jgi:hypothetical protein